MSTVRVTRFVFSLEMLALAVVPALGMAQEPVEPVRLLGAVSDARTSLPISEALVSIVGTSIQTRTAEDGWFTLPDATVGAITVRVQAQGYPVMVEDLEVPADEILVVHFMVPGIDAVLEGLLVLGTPEGGRDVSDHAPATALDLLAEEIPGIRFRNGDVGSTDYQIRLRGASSFTANSEPFVFLDGVRMSGGLGAAFQILNEIPAAEVSDIQVLKGPAAAFISGSANGAILVETRRGRPTDL